MKVPARARRRKEPRLEVVFSNPSDRPSRPSTLEAGRIVLSTLPDGRRGLRILRPNTGNAVSHPAAVGRRAAFQLGRKLVRPR